MHFKLIVAMVDDTKTRAILEAARQAGAKGLTVLNQARGEGLHPDRTFFGLSIDSQVDVVLSLVEEHFAQRVLEAVAKAGAFDDASGAGIAFQVDVEDAIGIRHQIQALKGAVEELI